ncbi:MAG: DNA translocase FtsK [Chloroflexia bacterium]|nr:DNA translocase FtsK [Chloroflexia bacterium]
MRPLPIDRQRIDTISRRVIDALDRLGYSYSRKDGGTQQVAIRRRLVTESGAFLLLEVDTERLPRGVRADQLTHRHTLHHLTTVVHHPVKVLNTTGITYVVLLQGSSACPRLPQQVELADALPQHPGTPWTFPVGEGPDGPVWERLRGHYLVGGETGSGKTSWLLSTILSLTLTNSPQDLRMVLIDPKGVDLLPFADLPHLARPLAVGLEEAGAALADLVDEIAGRRQRFARCLARDLDGYNERSGEKLPRLLVVIDEVTDLALTAGLKSNFYKDLTRLASLGRAFGVHLLLATQNPKAEVLNTLIRGNLAGRIAFRVTTPAHSRVILGLAGAERLGKTPGRMLARLGGAQQQELQGYWVGEEALLALKPEDPTGPLTCLDEQDRAMVRYAQGCLEGRFPQAEIMENGWTRSEYRETKEKLEQAGLLERRARGAFYLVDDFPGQVEAEIT